jgi:hypothetical protein
VKRGVLAVIVAVVLVVGAGEAALATNIVHAHQTETARKQTLADTRNKLIDVNATITDEQQTYDQTQRDIKTRTDEVAAARSKLANAQGKLASVTRNLNSATTAENEAAADAANLSKCVNGGKLATAERKNGNTSIAIATLRVVQPICASLPTDGDNDPYVFPFDFADPSVLRVGGTYYAYSTNSAIGNMPVIASTDLHHWMIVGDALPSVPSWALAGGTWAPTVIAFGGHYIAYYTVRRASDWVSCISVATSGSPAGPFVDTSTQPLMCQPELGGSIDPEPFIDGSGTPWLLWKSQGGKLLPAMIWSRQLNADGLGVNVFTVNNSLIQADRGWEAGTVEAPDLVAVNGELVLFYSGNNWSSSSYALGAARCSAPAGPCVKIGSGPVYTSHGLIAGPGSAGFFATSGGGLEMVYDAYHVPNVGYPASRFLYVAGVHVSGSSISFG